jgi:Flp pilus assembly pilin Flp
MTGSTFRRPGKKLLTAFLAEEVGQDITEYTLLLSFVVLVSAAIFLGSSGSFTGIWGSANSMLVNASSRIK